MMELLENNISDIEDLISVDSVKPKERYNNKEQVTVRPKKRVLCNSNDEEYTKPTILQSIIPGTQKIYVKTWGCSHNNADTEYMMGQLAAYGYNLTNEKEAADLWLLNSCTVKSPSEDTFRNEINRGLQSGKHIVVAGCVPQGSSKADYLRNLSVIGVQQIDRVVDVVEETLKGHTVRLLKQKKQNGKRIAGAKLALPKVRKNPFIEIIPINTGCLNQCTYCKTKHARGDLASYIPEEILMRAQQAFQEGCREIWLTSEDTGAYGRDIGTSLPELLWQLAAVVPNDCMLRVGMTNPPYILEHLEEIANILQHPRIYAFLHVPVQSGSDAVLSDMRREYCRKEFEHVVDFLKSNVPNVTIATDIICGFPTETEKDFEETFELCKKYKFPSLFINQFYPRPGTPAAKMPRIPTQLVKQRTKRLSNLFNSYKPYAGREGHIYDVLVTEISHDKQYYVGHNKSYEQVLLPMKVNLLGMYVKVRITSTTKFSMFAELLDENKETEYSKKSEEHGLIEPQKTHNTGFILQQVLSLCILVASVAFAVHWLFWKLE